MSNEEFEQLNLDRRASSEVFLDGSKPILIMLDGKNFSKYTKRFNAPFDDSLRSAMNYAASQVAKAIPGIQFAFVQSDEMSFYLKPNGTEWFNWRMSKMCSIIASIVTVSFVKVLDLLGIESGFPNFDCKVWNVDTFEEVKEWFIFRQKDCVRNSKQQFSQYYLNHKTLNGLSSNEQIDLVMAQKGENWHIISPQFKYGSFLKKTKVVLNNLQLGTTYHRNKWLDYACEPTFLQTITKHYQQNEDQ